MRTIITLFLSAIGGIVFANMIMYGDERRSRQKQRERERRKKLGKKWYDD